MKLIKVYWEGIKFAIKFVEADAIIIKTKAKQVISKLSIFPIMSVGLVNIIERLSGSLFKKASVPATINNAKKENIIKLSIKLIFPFFNSLSFFTYREKSPKVKITIEKKAKVVPATVINGPKLL